MEQVSQERRPVLEAIELTKRYEDGLLALDHVSFSVYPGQIFAMLGANGAGKTTAINLFLDFIPPSEGDARIAGISVRENPLQAKKHVAFVSENVMLYGNLTAIQNLDYFARLAGYSGYTRQEYRAVLARVGLQEEAHDRKLREFSKGMRQKCGIAIAILKDASAILLDEPTSGLDPQAAHEFLGLLRTLRDAGKGILMSTHDLFRAKEVADVVGIMNAGRLVMVRGREALAHEDLEQLYIRYVEAPEVRVKEAAYVPIAG
jgi:ABC-2 type transport system ATP-binding protein